MSVKLLVPAIQPCVIRATFSPLIYDMGSRFVLECANCGKFYGNALFFGEMDMGQFAHELSVKVADAVDHAHECERPPGRPNPRP